MEETILIIEDNAEICDNMSEILQLSNYKVVTAGDGKTGVKLALEIRPDLILCDIMMPELDGYGVLRAIEKNPGLNGVPFVYVTAKSEKADFRHGMDMGADDYLVKPFTGDELLRVVEARLKKSNGLRNKLSSDKAAGEEAESGPDSLRALTEAASGQFRKKFARKDHIYMEGDTLNYVYFLVSGKVRTFKTNYWGKEYITGLYKESDFFGYLSALDSQEHTDSASAVEDSEVVFIGRNEFNKLLENRNQASLTMIKMLSRDVTEAGNKLIHLAYDSARKKVAEALLYVHKKYIQEGKAGSFPVYRETISALAGLSPESVSRNITDLKEEGIVDSEDGKITILDIKKLENLKW